MIFVFSLWWWLKKDREHGGVQHHVGEDGIRCLVGISDIVYYVEILG